ncbi:uncharacterized protein LOC144007859 [Festucalex cinctus]
MYRKMLNLQDLGPQGPGLGKPAQQGTLPSHVLLAVVHQVVVKSLIDNMAPPVQMVQSIRHDQLVSNMNATCTFQSKWGRSEFLQSRRLLADEAAGCSKMKEIRLIGVVVLSCVEDDGVPADGQSSTTNQQLSLFLLILHPQGRKEGDELPENAVVWKQSYRKLILVQVLLPGQPLDHMQ